MSRADENRDRMPPGRWQAAGSWVPSEPESIEGHVSRRERKIQELEILKQEIAHLSSLRPVPLIRSRRRLEHTRRKLDRRLVQIEEEIRRLGGE